MEWQVFDIEAWKQEYKERHREALNHFKGRESDLLVFNASAGDGWEKLCPFLDKPIPPMPFPKANTTTLKEKLIAHLFSVFGKLFVQSS